MGDAGRRGTGLRGERLLPAVRASLEEHLGEEYGDVLGDVRLHAGRFAAFLCRRFGAGAMAFGRRIYFSPSGWRRYLQAGPAGVALAAHEAVHVLQYRRHGLPRMLARYLWQYLRGRLRGLGHTRAYRAIDYEREAFAVEAEVRRRLGGG